jgi:hypothetical protein
MATRRFTIEGDGESMTLRVDLTKSPVMMNFNLNKPTVVYARDGRGAGCDVYLSIEGTILKFDFPDPIPVHERVSLDVEFLYVGESDPENPPTKKVEMGVW